MFVDKLLSDDLQYLVVLIIKLRVCVCWLCRKVMVADRRDVKKYINEGGDLEVRFYGRDVPTSCFEFVQVGGCGVCDR